MRNPGQGGQAGVSGSALTAERDDTVSVGEATVVDYSVDNRAVVQ